MSYDDVELIDGRLMFVDLMFFFTFAGCLMPAFRFFPIRLTSEPKFQLFSRVVAKLLLLSLSNDYFTKTAIEP